MIILIDAEKTLSKSLFNHNKISYQPKNGRQFLNVAKLFTKMHAAHIICNAKVLKACRN